LSSEICFTGIEQTKEVFFFGWVLWHWSRQLWSRPAEEATSFFLC